MTSRIITSEEVGDFLKEIYGTESAIVCIWSCETPPKVEWVEDLDGSTVARLEELEQIELYFAKDIESLYFPYELEYGDWNKVIVCSTFCDSPDIGWMMISEAEKVFIKEWPLSLKFRY